MGIRLVRQIFDDIDGTPIDEDQEAQATLIFSIGKQQYLIHLNESNLEKFHEQMGYWIEHAHNHKPMRKSKKHNKTEPSPEVPTTPKPSDKRSQRHKRPGIFKWAKDNGWGEFSGRMPRVVEDAYDEAHGS